MPLECPLCGGENAIDQEKTAKPSSRLVCDHCAHPLRLDTYSGQLLPGKKRPVTREAVPPRSKRSRTPIDPIFQPRLSTGRDTLAAAFVILCIVAILTAGLSLMLGMRAKPIAWPQFQPTELLAQIEETLARFLVGSPSPQSGNRNIHLQRGRKFVKQGAYAKGLHELNKAVQENPESHVAHFWRGRALVKSGRDDEAIIAFETVIKINPRYSYAYDNLGWIHLRRNEYEISLDYLNQSLSLRPDNGWAYYNRGRIHLQLGQNDKAHSDARSACRLKFQKACQLLKRLERETQS